MSQPTTEIVLLYLYVTAVQWVYLHADHHKHRGNDLYYDIMTMMTSLHEVLFSSILILWDPQHMDGQLLTELLLCGK